MPVRALCILRLASWRLDRAPVEAQAPHLEGRPGSMMVTRSGEEEENARLSRLMSSIACLPVVDDARSRASLGRLRYTHRAFRGGRRRSVHAPGSKHREKNFLNINPPDSLDDMMT
jgi:hypothetical protein